MQPKKLGQKRTMYTGHIFSIHEQDVIFPDGSTQIFEYCERPTSVSVLALNEKEELLMIQERRAGYDHNTWFLPGGRVERDEPLEVAAMRELREETGYAAKELQLISKKSPGATLQWDIYTYAARTLYKSPLPNDPGEYTKPIFMPLQEAVEMALSGIIDNEFISYHIIRFDYMLKHGEFTWSTT